VQAGLADIALAVGVEKMHDANKGKSMAIFDGGWDVTCPAQSLERLVRLGDGIEPPPGRETPAGRRSVFMDVYASLARAHMKQFGTTERQLAHVAAKNHQHSTLNPLAQFRYPMSVEEILASRVIAWPLTLPMCAPVSDGAAAVILASEAAVRRLGRSRAVRVAASVLASGSDRNPTDPTGHVCHRAALRAYEMAGLGPKDVSVAEVHDASAFAEVLQTENLGFCEFGAGGSLVESGSTRLGGATPVNPSGGLLSKGHPIAATGLAQIFELVAQLRCEAGSRQVPGARVGIAENGGGIIDVEEAAACITILSH
jgi:acetyl-CoA acetyltransferase